MEMIGKELPLYRVATEPDASEQLVAYGIFNKQPCSLNIIHEGGDHLLVATVNDKRVAVSGKQLLGVAASLGV